jgi:hypothetical protein
VLNVDFEKGQGGGVSGDLPKTLSSTISQLAFIPSYSNENIEISAACGEAAGKSVSRVGFSRQSEFIATPSCIWVGSHYYILRLISVFVNDEVMHWRPNCDYSDLAGASRNVPPQFQ